MTSLLAPKRDLSGLFPEAYLKMHLRVHAEAMEEIARNLEEDEDL